MPQAETMSRVLNAMSSEGKKELHEPDQVDGKAMPDYDVVRRSLGPSGCPSLSEADGWFAKGVLLNKQSQ